MTLIRPFVPPDRDFVISTWSASYRTSHYAGLLSMARYADVMHTEIARIIDHPSTLTLVAEQPGETDEEGRPFLYGFVAAAARHRPESPPYVYYVYVKSPYRRGKERHGMAKGYGQQLLEAVGCKPRAPFRYACQTSISLQLAAKIPLGEWDPLPARYLEAR